MNTFEKYLKSIIPMSLAIEVINGYKYKIYAEASRLNEVVNNKRFYDIVTSRLLQCGKIKSFDGWHNDYPFKFAIVEIANPTQTRCRKQKSVQQYQK